MQQNLPLTDLRWNAFTVPLTLDAQAAGKYNLQLFKESGVELSKSPSHGQWFPHLLKSLLGPFFLIYIFGAHIIVPKYILSPCLLSIEHGQYSVIRVMLRAGDVSRGKRGRHPHGNCSQRGEKSSPHIITQKCHQACLAVYLREWNVVLCTERLIPSGGHARCCQSIVLLSHLPPPFLKNFPTKQMQ